MGSGQSNESGRGFRVIKMIPNSPAEHAGLELFFDFIIELDGVNLQNFDNQRQDLFFKKIRESVEKPIKLKVFNIRTNSIREVCITPSKWIFNGVLGTTIRYDSYDASSSLESLRVLEIQENSPAKQAGLIEKYDFIIATNDNIIKSLEEFIDCASQHLEKPLEIFVYNSFYQNIRKVKIFPSNKWGGKGILGCNIGSGYLHKIPQSRKIEESKEIVNLNTSLNFPCYVPHSVMPNSYAHQNPSLNYSFSIESVEKSSFTSGNDHSHVSASCFSSDCVTSPSSSRLLCSTVMSSEPLNFQESNVNKDEVVFNSDVNYADKKVLLSQNSKSDEGRVVVEGEFENVHANNNLKNINRNLCLESSNSEVFEKRSNNVLNTNSKDVLNEVCEFGNLNSYNNIVNDYNNNVHPTTQHLYNQEIFESLNVEKGTDLHKNGILLNANTENKSRMHEKTSKHNDTVNNNLSSCSSSLPFSSSIVYSTTSSITPSYDSSSPCYFSSDKNFLHISSEKDVNNNVMNEFNTNSNNVIINSNENINEHFYNTSLMNLNSCVISKNNLRVSQKKVFSNEDLDAATFYYYQNLIPYPGVIYPSAVDE